MKKCESGLMIGSEYYHYQFSTQQRAEDLQKRFGVRKAEKITPLTFWIPESKK
jgi:hypothetical protein